MATYEVRSTSDIFNIVVVNKMKELLSKVAIRVKETIDNYIEQYYQEYDPAWRADVSSYWYRRTDQLRDCCKISKPRITPSGVEIEIYLDISSLNYSTKGADPYKTVVAANSGLHGGWVIEGEEPLYQVPFNELNEESDYGGTRIWSDPMQELLEGGKLKELFLTYAKQYGLNLIAK